MVRAADTLRSVYLEMSRRVSADTAQLVSCFTSIKLSSDPSMGIKQWAQWCTFAIQALGRQRQEAPGLYWSANFVELTSGLYIHPLPPTRMNMYVHTDIHKNMKSLARVRGVYFTSV